ncbi:TIM-barrel domain-containing protein [Nocardioides sp.]|uniref:TIM-barrel domain-containing protein n=1 Tax=Nocardioides sp. TaxID=35761 RepID=UPI00260C8513|nr:TIM-barrel domain-containing protein [Nocardioides sp.]MDI6909121.1 glycoside hydrolase family 31 protein [Nocardioides sp.]
MPAHSMLSPLAGLALVTGLLVTGAPATSAEDGPDGRASGGPAPDGSGGMHAVVTAPVGGDWALRFVDDDGTVLATVARDAIALVTATGRVPADHVLAVHDDVVELGTADPALTANVRVSPAGDGAYAVAVTGQGSGITAVSIDLRAPRGERYLGLGERSDAVDHRGRTVQNRVLDGPYTTNQAALVAGFVPQPGFSSRADATYFPVPWMLSTAGYGVLVDNDEDSSFELATPQHPDVNRLVVQSDRLDLRVFPGPTPARALTRMTGAVGRQPAPASPMAYGAWWQPIGDAAAELAEQRDRDVAISVAQTYAHYLPCGAQDSSRERTLTQSLHDRGVGVTTYFNPMVCTSYQPVYDEGVAAGAFTRNPDGSPLVYRYSTASNFRVSQFDFSAAAGRDLFHRLLDEAVADGYDGWMEDFGEYTPGTAVSADGTPGPTMHNRYVEQYHATARDFETRAPRPLLRFNRSGWTDAIKESSIVWGGDPTTSWDFDGLTSSVRQGLTSGTSGLSFWGPDIGGFFTLIGDPKLTPELLARWIEYGAFTGVMRLQSGGISIGVSGARPNVTDPGVAPVWKRYTRLRTMLYPYIAGSQDAYLQRGLPLMRHLVLAHPGDRRAVRTDDEYLFGRDLLVAPVTSPGTSTRQVYLPGGHWIELARAWRLRDDGRFHLRRAEAVRGHRTVTARAPLGTIPLFLRAGAVVPLLPRGVDTLSDYGDGIVRLADRAARRTLLAAPRVGASRGTLGPGETLRSEVTGGSWTLRLDATDARTYAVRATLAGLDPAWRPCGVRADGDRVPFEYAPSRRVLRFTAGVSAAGEIEVTACR